MVEAAEVAAVGKEAARVVVAKVVVLNEAQRLPPVRSRILAHQFVGQAQKRSCRQPRRSQDLGEQTAAADAAVAERR